MNPPEDQYDSSPAPRYVDPEELDMSEQQFSASLESAGERPRFELDESGERPGRARPASLPSPMQEQRSQTSKDAADEASALPADMGPPALDWREQVSAKVSSYKSRRPRKNRYPSLQLQFEPGYPSEKVALDDSAPLLIPENTTRTAAAETPVFLETAGRVLEFPRPTPPPIRREELAEPVIDWPRIIEAPELLPPPPAMGGILIEPPSDPQPQRKPGFDVPLQTGELGRRVWAGVIDVVLVTIAASGFGYIFLRLTGVLPQWRTALEMIVGLFAVLWPSYQYSLVVFSGTTPGLRFAKLSILRFDGTPAPRKLRRWRVLASVLSGASLGLGYAWCFFDEDRLSWHDRITRTHLTTSGKGKGEGT